jgi:hypothetical protein
MFVGGTESILCRFRSADLDTALVLLAICRAMAVTMFRTLVKRTSVVDSAIPLGRNPGSNIASHFNAVGRFAFVAVAVVCNDGQRHGIEALCAVGVCFAGV